jgi:hypothetical protein
MAGRSRVRFPPGLWVRAIPAGTFPIRGTGTSFAGVLHKTGHIRKVPCGLPAAALMSSLVESRKNATPRSSWTKKLRAQSDDSGKRTTRLRDFSEKIRYSWQTFLKKSVDVAGLSGVILPTLSNFSKKTKGKNRPSHTLSYRDPSRILRKNPARLPDFSKIVRHSHRTL